MTPNDERFDGSGCEELQRTDGQRVDGQRLDGDRADDQRGDDHRNDDGGPYSRLDGSTASKCGLWIET